MNIWTVARQAPLSMEQEYWGRLQCPPSGDPTDPGTESVSPALQADSLPTEASGKTHMDTYMVLKIQVQSCSTYCSVLTTDFYSKFSVTLDPSLVT